MNSNQPNTGGVKSYQNATRYLNKALGSINTLSSTSGITTPSGGAWEATYDIWDTGNRYETMIWLNYTGTSTGGGNVKPISFNYDASGNAVPVYTNVSIGGATWNVFQGNNGSNAVFSFLRTTKTNNTTVDAKAILNWMVAKRWMSNVTIGNYQFGFEITSTSGTQAFAVNSYSLTVN